MDKVMCRKECIRRLRSRKFHQNYIHDKLIVNHLSNFIKKSRAKNVMLYIPLNIEVNICSLIKALRMSRKNVFVPFMEGESFRLVKYKLPLKIKKFNIKEPTNKNSYYKKIDLAVIPTIAIDSTFRRIGFGKGMYDRFFDQYQANIENRIFISRVDCYQKDVMTDNHDVIGDYYITPKKNIKRDIRCKR